jgi:shikimate kinase
MAKIFLIGYMGSGKSSTGTALALKIGYEFVDLDRFIEKEQKLTIPEIFSTRGEQEFRAMEHNALKKVLKKDNIIIACGGGTPCYYNNLELMNNNGITVYLKMSAEALVDRLKNAREKRPLIENKNEQELHDFVGRQLERREEIYSRAQFIVKAKNLNVDELVEFLKEEVCGGEYS